MITKRLDIEYDLGQLVYIIHDPEQMTYMVTAIIVRPNRVEYELCSGEKNLHVDPIEISITKKIF